MDSNFLLQGTIPDDVSVLWPSQTSECTEASQYYIDTINCGPELKEDSFNSSLDYLSERENFLQPNLETEETVKKRMNLHSDFYCENYKEANGRDLYAEYEMFIS